MLSGYQFTQEKFEKTTSLTTDENCTYKGYCKCLFGTVKVRLLNLSITNYGQINQNHQNSTLQYPYNIERLCNTSIKEQ